MLLSPQPFRAKVRCCFNYIDVSSAAFAADGKSASMAHFEPTRSGTGMTHASGQALPLIRTLLDTLVCEPQARLPAHPGTFPGNDILGTRGKRFCWIKVGGQKRRIQITLHRTHSARALVPALRKRLFAGLAAPVTELAEFGRACGN